MTYADANFIVSIGLVVNIIINGNISECKKKDTCLTVRFAEENDSNYVLCHQNL